MKTLEEIYQEMRADYAARAGVAVADGGDMALRLYAAAVQIHALWVQADYLSRQSFPQTAEGEALENHAAVRGLRRGEAVCARGKLRFYTREPAATDVTVAAGTVCLTAAGTEVVTLEDGVILSGTEQCLVNARAVEPGISGNVPAESVVFFAQAPVGVAGCVNPQAFADGAEAETDEALRARVLNSYQKLPNGANAAYYEETVAAVDGVAAVAVLPRNRGVGTVDVVFTTAEGLPSAALVSQVQDLLEEKREICVDVEVSAPQAVTVNVSAAVATADEADFTAVSARIRAALEAYFDGSLLGKDVLRAKLGNLIYGTEGVANYSLTAPAADLAVGETQLPVLGTVTLTQMS